MHWPESLVPLRMERVVLVSPTTQRRAMLETLAAHGQVELDLPHVPEDTPAEVERAADAAVTEGRVTGLVGWTPARRLVDLRETLATVGASAVVVPHPRGVTPPTALDDRRPPDGPVRTTSTSLPRSWPRRPGLSRPPSSPSSSVPLP